MARTLLSEQNQNEAKKSYEIDDFASEAMTDDERKMDGNMDNTELEGNERNKIGDVDEANGVTRVSSLTRLRNLATDVTTKGIR